MIGALAWKRMLGVDLVGFNSPLTKNNLPPLKITLTMVTAERPAHLAGQRRAVAK